MELQLDADCRSLGFPPKPMVRDVKGSKYYRCVVTKLDYKKGQVLLQWEYAFSSASFWLPFSSDRIWAGSYKHRDWTNQGEGAWKPTPAAVAAAAAQESAIRKAQQLAVARGGTSAPPLPNPPRQAATAQKQQQQQQRSLKREPEQQSHGRPPKQPRSSRSASPDTTAAADTSQLKGRLAAADSSAAGGAVLPQLKQSSSCPQPPELPSASSEAAAASTRHAPAALLAADGAVACAAAVAAEQDTASTQAAPRAPEAPAAADLEQQQEPAQVPEQPEEVPEQLKQEPEQLKQEQPEQPLQEQPQQLAPEQPGKGPPEAHKPLAAGAALLPAGKSRKRARSRLKKPQPGLRPADQRPANELQEPSEAAGPGAAAAAAVPAAGCCEAGTAVDPAPGSSKVAHQPADRQPAVNARGSSRAGVRAAASAGAMASDAELLSKPHWLGWLQLAATDPQAALSGSGTALQQLVRAVRQNKRAWGKAKARAGPQLSPGRGRSRARQEPAVVPAAAPPAEPPGWLRWLRRDVCRDPLAALAAAGGAQQDSMEAANAFVRARGQAAVASSQGNWLPDSLSESALSHLRQHAGQDIVTNLRQVARNVEAAAVAAAEALPGSLGSPAEAASLLPTTSQPVAAAEASPRPRLKPHSAARRRSGQPARQRVVPGGGFSAGAAGAARLLRSLQQRYC